MADLVFREIFEEEKEGEPDSQLKLEKIFLKIFKIIDFDFSEFNYEIEFKQSVSDFDIDPYNIENYLEDFENIESVEFSEFESKLFEDFCSVKVNLVANQTIPNKELKRGVDIFISSLARRVEEVKSEFVNKKEGTLV